MRSITITIFSVACRLVALAIANPIPNWKAGGIAISLARESSFLDSNKTIDFDTISSHGISVRERILSGLDNYEMNTGTMHPFAVKRSDSESGLGTRGTSIPLAPCEDNMWMCEISIGTPAKTLKVRIDTVAGGMWVLQTGCLGIHGDCDLWDPGSSKSAKNQRIHFRSQYADGLIVEGDQYIDNVTIAGFTADPHTFGSVTSHKFPALPNNGNADGLLGLAFPSVSRSGVPLFESLVRQNRLINPTFAFKLSSSGAEMYVGGTNSMLYNGDITYTHVTVPGMWQVSMDDLRVNGNTVLENVPAIFDTGANYIFGDWERVSELYGRIGGTLHEGGAFGIYHLPCDSFPIVSFTFGGRSFEIPPEVLKLHPTERGSPNCLSAIVAQRSRIKFWNIGMTFLQGVYSVFDYTNLQVGFADLARIIANVPGDLDVHESIHVIFNSGV